MTADIFNAPPPAASTPGKPTLLTTTSLAKLSDTTRHRVVAAVACGDLQPDAFLDLDGRLQPLFSPNAAIVLLALMRGAGAVPLTPPPIFCQSTSQ